uniref:Uncharacterized protein n=1 Tax=Sphaerodactylus townsendi TaxID=933632 RepID=A0ACB8E5I2_9SAUR
MGRLYGRAQAAAFPTSFPSPRGTSASGLCRWWKAPGKPKEPPVGPSWAGGLRERGEASSPFPSEGASLKGAARGRGLGKGRGLGQVTSQHVNAGDAGKAFQGGWT